MAPPPHPPSLGPYMPTLVLHGGAGAVTRAHLPPPLYARYAKSLSCYTSETNALLQTGHSALDAACHAVTLMEDDELFNCGKGSVFAEDGEIEMEASVMVSSVSSSASPLHSRSRSRSPKHFQGSIKRGAAVSLIRETRHPILLAREVLLQGDESQGLGSMHCHRSGKGVEEWGWVAQNLERKGKEWFWTKRRWEEHLRGLKGSRSKERNQDLLLLEDVTDDENTTNETRSSDDHFDGMTLPSQGTVGAVCMDSWGNLAVATSTGGLTNKKAGRIGDTPTLGAGFWAEGWVEGWADEVPVSSPESGTQGARRRSQPGPLDLAAEELGHVLTSCIPSFTFQLTRPLALLKTTERVREKSRLEHLHSHSRPQQYTSPALPSNKPHPRPHRRRAIALSGTGNGDSFLRTAAAHTVAAQCRFTGTSLSQAITNVAGYDGELQRSAGNRWGRTGEGEGGMIGIEVEVESDGRGSETERGGGKRRIKGRVVADFNCGGMWRAWIDEKTGEVRVMVFREEYK